jgi:hypothetical protein
VKDKYYGVVKPIDPNDPKTDKDHREFLELKLKKRSIENELESVKKEIEEKENHLLKEMDKGKKFDWCWKTIIKRTNVKWKDMFIKYVGKKEADKISAETPETKYPHVYVSGFDPEPEQSKPKRKVLRRKLSL